MKNVHTRELAATIDEIRPWIEACWTGTPQDPFPRDLIPTWRKNPPGVAPLALVPGVTRLGHGPFAFRLESWDGQRWRVTVESEGFVGWHGIDLDPTPRGCRVTHTIELELAGPARVVWPVVIAPLHDWAVEAIFDRLEEALETGVMPTVTRRPIPWPASTWYTVVNRVLRARRRRPITERSSPPAAS